MGFIGLVIAALCVVALFCGAARALGSVAIALVKYVVFPAGALIAFLWIVKCCF